MPNIAALIRLSPRPPALSLTSDSHHPAHVVHMPNRTLPSMAISAMDPLGMDAAPVTISRSDDCWTSAIVGGNVRRLVPAIASTSG